MPCSACGTQNRPGSRFCDQCGAPLSAACPRCGEDNRPDARFCAGCGATLRSAAPAAHHPGAGSTEADASHAAERRLVTVMFTDIVGFTTLAEDRDPEAVRELLSTYFDTATRIVELHGGTVEKFIGDAVMAVWGTPVSHEDDAERAVRAALELVAQVATLHPGLRARAGVLSGDAAVTIGATNQGMVAGDLVNTAARLQGVAEPGTVLAGEATMRAAADAVVFEPIGDHSLKGKTSPVPAWRALRVVAARGGQGRADGLEPPFVGRQEELRQLKEALHAAGRERRPRLVSITGPGGIGKSRLVWELDKYVDGVAEDIWWHRGRSPSYGEGVTFWALGEMVRRRAQLTEEADEATVRQHVATTLAEYIPDPGERERIGPALLTLLGIDEAPPGGRDALFPAWRLFFERIAERGTTVLVFEDLQWADAGLLDFVDHLLDWSRGLPIVVVTLARPELFDRRPDWGAGRRQVTALALEPLADEEIRELLEGLVPGLPVDALAAIVGRAEGVPLYAVEMVRGLLADGRIERRGEVYVPSGDLSELRVPDSLRSLIGSRLDALPAADRSLLQDASVLGQVFSAEALAAVVGSTAAELEPRLRDLVRRELLDLERDPASPEVGQYKFVQSLIREVAYGTLSRRDRRGRHLAVARHFEALGDDELSGALAAHYLAAHEASDEGPEADAVATQARIALSAAAERASALGSPQEAVRRLEQAVALTADPAERAALLVRAAEAATAAAIEAVPYATAAIEAYEAIGETSAAARARALLGRIHIDASEMEPALQVLTRAVDDARSAGDAPGLAAAAANLARVHMRLGEAEPAIRAADEALPIAERLNLEPIVAEALNNKAAGMSILGRRREAVGLMRAAVEIARRSGSTALQLRVENNLGAVLSDDDPAAGMRLMFDTLGLARQIGDLGMYNWTVGNLAVAVYAHGRGWDEHAALIEEALEHAVLRGDRARLVAMLGVIRIAQGERVEELVAEVDTLTEGTADTETVFSREMTRATAALAGGDADAAYRVVIALRPVPNQVPELGAQLALHTAAWQRDPARVREAAAWLDALQTHGEYSESYRAAARGAVAAVDGNRSEALAHFRDARRRLEQLEQHFDAALIVLDALHLMPDEPEVRGWAASARELAASLRARPFVERLDAVLAEAPAASASPVADRVDERVTG